MDLSNMMDIGVNGLTVDEDVRSGMNIVDGDEYKKAFTAVSHATANVLKNTLGPFGRTTVIDDGSSHYITKDGWNIVNRLGFGQPLYNTLYSFIKDASYNMVEKVGDGTTTVIVAADEFIHQMEKDHDFDSFRQRDILNMLNDVKDKVIENLRSDKYLHEIDKDGNFEDIYRIAFTSTNENEEISRMIQQIYQKTHNPTIYVNMGLEKNSSFSIVNGYQLDCAPRGLEGFINTDDDKYRTTDGILTFFCNHNMTYVDHYHVVKRLLSIEQSLQRQIGRSAPRIAIFAPHFDDALAGAIEGTARTAIQNHDFPPIMMVQCGMTTQYLQDVFADAAVVTGSRVFTPNDLEALLQAESGKDKRGTELEDKFAAMREINPEIDGIEKGIDYFVNSYLGNVSKFTASKNNVIFSDFNAETQRYKVRYSEVKRAYEETRKKADKVITMMDKEMLYANLRYVRFSGNMGTIIVGGGSEAETRCLKDSVDDAVLSCRSAYENGYVKGMNLATIGAINDYKKELARQYDNDISKSKDPRKIGDFKLRITVVSTLEKVFINVTKAIMQNKYPDDVDTSMAMDWNDRSMNADQVITSAISANKGFNIVTDKFEDSDNLQVTNSVVCDIEVLSACVSILSHVLTSNQLLSVNRVYDTTLQNKVKEYKSRMGARILAEEFKKVFKDNLPEFTECECCDCEAIVHEMPSVKHEKNEVKKSPEDYAKEFVDFLKTSCNYDPDAVSDIIDRMADKVHALNDKFANTSKKKDIAQVKKAMDDANVVMADPSELKNDPSHPAEADFYFKSSDDMNV